MGGIFTFEKRVILQVLRYFQQFQRFETVERADIGTFSEIRQITWTPGIEAVMAVQKFMKSFEIPRTDVRNQI